MADDYIRRQDVLNLPQSVERNLRGEIVERSVDVGAIEALEPADVVQVVHARWETYRPVTTKCSQCGDVMNARSDTECKCSANCGAKMDGKKEG